VVAGDALEQLDEVARRVGHHDLANADTRDDLVAEVVAARIPGARVERFPGAGHLFFWEQHEHVVRVVSEFLA